MSLKFLVKDLLHSVFSTNHLKHKTVDKTFFQSFSVNADQLCTH